MLDRLETSQGKIAYAEHGSSSSKKAALFIHGHLTNQTFFQNQMESPHLQSYRLITIDLPGYGKSEPPKNPEKVYSFPGFADAVAEFVDLMGLQDLVIVGWSLGGHVALELTAKLDRLKGIFISGTPPIELSLEGIGKGFSADPDIMQYFGKGNLEWSEAEKLATISGYDYTDAKKFLVEAIFATDEGAKTLYPASIGKGVGANELDIVQNWPNPIAVVGGENDTGVNYDYIKTEVPFRNLWRKQVHLIPNCGHAVHMEKPQEFNRYLQAFLEETF